MKLSKSIENRFGNETLNIRHKLVSFVSFPYGRGNGMDLSVYTDLFVNV